MRLAPAIGYRFRINPILLLAIVTGAVAAAASHVVIVATHDRELVELLDGRYAPAHLSDALGPDGLAFDYQLRPGPATSRNAIALLALNGAPAAVVGAAAALARSLDEARRGAGAP